MPAQKAWIKLTSSSRDIKRTDDVSAEIRMVVPEPEPLPANAGAYDQNSPSS